jgi:hypothetical protein
MQDITIKVLRATSSDAESLAAVYESAWRTAYLGIIPGPELDELIIRRGTEWWEGAIGKGSRISILVFGGTVAGYSNYGRNRARSLAYDGKSTSFTCVRSSSGGALDAACLRKGESQQVERDENRGQMLFAVAKLCSIW